MNDEIVKQYQLKEIIKICIANHGILYKAISLKYGSVVVKINTDVENYFNSCRYYPLFKNLPICKLYANNDKYHIQILEYISGKNLFSIENVKERIELSFNFFKKWSENLLHIKDYTIWYQNKVCNMIQIINKICLTGDLNYLFKRFVVASKHFFAIYDNSFLLHGDLHQFNMLYDRNIISVDLTPKIASFAIEIAKFIENELFAQQYKVGYLLDLFVKYYRFKIIDTDEILEGLFIDSCYRTFESFMENGNRNDLLKGTLINANILNYIEGRNDAKE
jgi:hypothetical protein